MSKIRLVLFPLSIIYDGVTRFKNYLFSKNLIPSAHFDIPVIVIGNLSTGGTGKTPHTEYFSNLVKAHKKTAVLSRGYGRKTSGYILASPQSTASEIGDEPLQIAQRVPGIDVAVSEDRALGITNLINTQSAEAIILDDAFQHRKVHGSLYILLTTFSQPFYDDYILPAGNLRETSQNKNRADIIIVTKCPLHLTEHHKNEIIKKINPLPYQRIFFTGIIYGTANSLFSDYAFSKVKNCLLVTGIVNPKPLEQYLKTTGKNIRSILYKDHHTYTQEDGKQIIKSLQTLSANSALVTTSKDAVKLKPLLKAFKKELIGYEIPITLSVLFKEEEELRNLITDHVKRN